MQNERRDRRSHELLQGQLESVATLIVARIDTVLKDSVIYRFPMGFEVTATKYGITLSGHSVNLTTPQMVQLHRVLFWANKIAQELRAGHGIPPQMELEKAWRLRVASRGDAGFEAWYAGHRQQPALRSTEAAAIKALREGFIG